MFEPSTLEVAMVSFEGPDQYSQAGGLGVRGREMCRAFAALGFDTTYFFVGDPSRPGQEDDDGVHLVRCIREVSRRYPAGVYEGERDKLAALTTSLPYQLIDQVVRPAAAAGRTVLVLFEEWHTAAICVRLDALLRAERLRESCVLLWNANNHFGFDEIDWPALTTAAGVTTVSKYMKHVMWPYGVNPVVVPNGIPQSSLRPVDKDAVRLIEHAAGTPCLAFKIGRFSADKRWHQALDAVAQLRKEGLPARLLMRGGIEGFGNDVLGHAGYLGLGVANWSEPIACALGVARALSETEDSAVVNLCTFLPDSVIPEIYAAATAVLANSGHEPFGLVGLEAMAAGGVAVVGATGEEYARPYGNAIVIETELGGELASALRSLVERPALAGTLRRVARRDAADFSWPNVIEGLIERLRFMAIQQGVGAVDVV